MVLEPATCRQAAWKFGQACCEQLWPMVRMSSRSPLARACGTLASTCGAKPGRTLSAVAISAAIAIAETALIMTVPCPGPLRPVIVGSIDNWQWFQNVFVETENGFVPPEFCVVARSRDETLSGLLVRRRRSRWGSGAGEFKKPYIAG